MDILEAIQKRTSVRQYLDRAVEMHDLGAVLEAGRLAPSAGNLQPWRFIIVKNNEKKHSLAEACQRQYWMTKAPVHIVVCADTEKAAKFYGKRGENLYVIQDCAAATENMMLAATALGLGTCWVGYFDEEEVRAICNIPPRFRAMAIMTLGHPAKTDKVEKQPIDRAVFFESFGNRIENPAKALNEWSLVWQQQAEELKKQGVKHGKMMGEHIKKAHEQIKHHSKKLVEKIKKK